jgi:hypothetical protein
LQQDKQQQLEKQRFERLLSLLEGVPSLTPSLRHWLVRRFRATKSYASTSVYLRLLHGILLSLQPFLPPSPPPTPASFQAVLLQPTPQKALLRCYEDLEKGRREKRGKDWGASKTAFSLFLDCLHLGLVGTERGVEVVVVEGLQEGWEGWGEGEEEEKEEGEEEGVKEEEEEEEEVEEEGRTKRSSSSSSNTSSSSSSSSRTRKRR